MNCKITVIGSYMTDLTVYTDRFPNDGEAVHGSFHFPLCKIGLIKQSVDVRTLVGISGGIFHSSYYSRSSNVTFFPSFHFLPWTH